MSSRVRLADVAPTILEAAGLPVPPAIQANSWSAKPDARTTRRTQWRRPEECRRGVRQDCGRASGFSRTSTEDRPVYAETDYPHQAFGWSSLLSWRTDQFLFVRAPKRERTISAPDARAAKNPADAQRAVADRLNDELDQFIRHRGRRRSGCVGRPQRSRRLASLGVRRRCRRRSGASNVDPK